jgi:BTB/POZ domain
MRRVDCDGTIFKTTTATLSKSKYLSKIVVNSKENTVDGIVVLDCNPKAFRHILEYLRCDKYEIPAKYIYLADKYSININAFKKNIPTQHEIDTRTVGYYVNHIEKILDSNKHNLTKSYEIFTSMAHIINMPILKTYFYDRKFGINIMSLRGEEVNYDFSTQQSEFKSEYMYSSYSIESNMYARLLREDKYEFLPGDKCTWIFLFNRPYIANIIDFYKNHRTMSFDKNIEKHVIAFIDMLKNHDNWSACKIYNKLSHELSL